MIDVVTDAGVPTAPGIDFGEFGWLWSVVALGLLGCTSLAIWLFHARDPATVPVVARSGFRRRRAMR
jgi:hypothetical protein